MSETAPLLPRSKSTVHSNASHRLSASPISFPRSQSTTSDKSATHKSGSSGQKSKPRPSRLPSFPPSHDPYPTSNPIPSPSTFSSSGLSSIGSDASEDSLATVDSTAVGAWPRTLTRTPHEHHHHHHHKHHHHHSHKDRHLSRAEDGERHVSVASTSLRHDGLPKLSRQCLWRSAV